jgi:hypothetical protein
MSRSGYTDEPGSEWDAICWRGQVASAIRGKRGQAFLRELIEALDAMPVKALIKNDLIRDTVEIDPFGGGYIPDDAPKVCALGSVGIGRGLNMEALDPEDYDSVADAFRIAPRLAQEIAFQNDDAAWHATPAERWQRMRDWAASRLKAAP